MQIKITGPYKSITNFEWSNIPPFAVITGPNGVGKSQLLKLINTKLSGNSRDPRVQEEKGKIDIQGIEIYLQI